MRKWILATALVASVTTRAAALDTKDLLALIAMPLAVAEVSNLSGVPADRLSNALAVLAGANLQPVQYVQVVEYAPVALVYDERNQTDFVNFVTIQTNQGITGDRFFNVVTTYYYDTYAIPQVTWSAPRVTEVYLTRPALPPLVVQRVAEIRLAPRVTTQVVTRETSGHPHGGPPGQVKKELGLQTGAEVVHGYKPGKGNHGQAKHQEIVRIAPSPAPGPPGQAKKGGEGPPGQMKKGGDGDHGGGNGHGNGNGGGKGHGKGGKG